MHLVPLLHFVQHQVSFSSDMTLNHSALEEMAGKFLYLKLSSFPALTGRVRTFWWLNFSIHNQSRVFLTSSRVFSASLCPLSLFCLSVGEDGGGGGWRRREGVMGGGLLPSICCDGRLGSPEGASAWPDRDHHWSVWHQASPQLRVLIRLLVDPQRVELCSHCSWKTHTGVPPLPTFNVSVLHTLNVTDIMKTERLTGWQEAAAQDEECKWSKNHSPQTLMKVTARPATHYLKQDCFSTAIHETLLV